MKKSGPGKARRSKSPLSWVEVGSLMRIRVVPALASLSFVAAVGCGPVQDPRSASPQDLSPPSVQSVRTTGPREIELVFDEEAQLVAEKLRIQPALAVGVMPSTASTRLLIPVEEQAPGRQYTLEATARDARGNSVSFIADIYGFNPKVPRMVLNEFIPRGSETHPDLLEIKVLAAGNMGGVDLYQGTPGSFQDRLIFPPFSVRAGDFILVHFKPSGDPAEVDEAGNRTASKGTDASEAAFDFWIPRGKGLGGNNGVISLYDRPGGGILDGVLYSNRTSASDDLYRGFGSAEALARAEELVRDGGWKTAGPEVAPEDAVNPDGSTATRSICRSSGSIDTDGRADWHVVPTRKSSFAADNSDEVYAP